MIQFNKLNINKNQKKLEKAGFKRNKENKLAYGRFLYIQLPDSEAQKDEEVLKAIKLKEKINALADQYEEYLKNLDVINLT